jgi:hypothetical protein
MRIYLYDILSHYDILTNDIMTLLNTKQINTYKLQYTIRY